MVLPVQDATAPPVPPLRRVTRSLRASEVRPAQPFCWRVLCRTWAPWSRAGPLARRRTCTCAECCAIMSCALRTLNLTRRDEAPWRSLLRERGGNARCLQNARSPEPRFSRGCAAHSASCVVRGDVPPETRISPRFRSQAASPAPSAGRNRGNKRQKVLQASAGEESTYVRPQRPPPALPLRRQRGAGAVVQASARPPLRQLPEPAGKQPVQLSEAAGALGRRATFPGPRRLPPPRADSWRRHFPTPQSEEGSTGRRGGLKTLWLQRSSLYRRLRHENTRTASEESPQADGGSRQKTQAATGKQQGEDNFTCGTAASRPKRGSSSSCTTSDDDASEGGEFFAVTSFGGGGGGQRAASRRGGGSAPEAEPQAGAEHASVSGSALERPDAAGPGDGGRERARGRAGAVTPPPSARRGLGRLAAAASCRREARAGDGGKKAAPRTA